uniref:Uncharacterized protein n=1 Tax=viral metagenome TaxID=1070528 RepID=A0A6M3LLJ1_9ZZZZ
MTIDEALYELEAIKNNLWHRGRKDKYWGDAVRLGMEALERCRALEQESLFKLITKHLSDNIALFDCQGDCPDAVALNNNLHTADYCNRCFAKQIIAIIKEALETKSIAHKPRRNAGRVEETKMSTRCQIGFYETGETNLEKWEALLYRHSDGYPKSEHGVVATIKPILDDFQANRGLDDLEYASAWLVAKLKTDYLNIGISKDFHGDIEFFYAVYPDKMVVYVVSGDDWHAWKELETIAL